MADQPEPATVTVDNGDGTQTIYARAVLEAAVTTGNEGDA